MPYDVSQMRFYEFYAMGVPIFMPSESNLPAYIYRGMTSISSFDLFLEDSKFKGKIANPFDSHRIWPIAQFWVQFTHYTQLPYVHHFDTWAKLFEELGHIRMNIDYLLEVSEAMQKWNRKQLRQAMLFWEKAIQVPESMGGYVCTKELYDMGSTFYSSLLLKIKKAI